MGKKIGTEIAESPIAKAATRAASSNSLLDWRFAPLICLEASTVTDEEIDDEMNEGIGLSRPRFTFPRMPHEHRREPCSEHHHEPEVNPRGAGDAEMRNRGRTSHQGNQRHNHVSDR